MEKIMKKSVDLFTGHAALQPLHRRIAAGTFTPEASPARKPPRPSRRPVTAPGRPSRPWATDSGDAFPPVNRELGKCGW